MWQLLRRADSERHYVTNVLLNFVMKVFVGLISVVGYGNVYIVVDMELKGLIREALIKMILGFDIALEIEEE